MTKEIKRGVPFPSGEVRKEAQWIGPYPTWDQWWPRVRDHFPNLVPENNDLVHLERFYTLRRLLQLSGKKAQEALRQIEEFWREMEEIDVEPKKRDIRPFEERHRRVIEFITEKTQSQPKR